MLFIILKKSGLFGAFLALLLALDLGQAGPARAAGEFSLIDPPLPTPNAGFKDQLGKRLTLADFRDEVVVLNFWASWCAPCIAEMPTLDALQGEMGSEGVRVIAVSLDIGGIKKAAPFFRRTGVKNLALYTDQRSELFQELKGSVLPTTFILDREGRVVESFIGPTDWNDDRVKERLRKYLAMEPAG